MVGNGYTTGTANPGLYQNRIKTLLDNPSSFASTPGYKFTMDQALEGVNRSGAAMRGSGNVMAALLDRAGGVASTGYDGYLKTLGGLSGQEQSYDLGLAGANNTAQGNANALTLGHEQNTNTATRNANDLTLGTQSNANTRTANDQQFGLGMYRAGNDYSLGQEQNANTAQNNWWNYDLGNQRNATDRSRAQSDAYLGDQNSQRAWYSVFPRQVYNGGNQVSINGIDTLTGKPRGAP